MSEIADKYNRFKDAPWFIQGIDVIVGGAGGIGSWLSLLLTRAGFQCTVFDFDVYEAHNMGGQFCSSNDIHSLKVEALKKNIISFCGTEIYAEAQMVTAETMSHKYVFSAFDNMKARKDMFKSWKAASQGHPDAIFIDGRLTMEQIQIFCITPEHADWYEKEHLFDDSVVADAPCTMRQTSHTAAIIGGMMTAFFTNHITNTVRPGEREVPKFFQLFTPMVYSEIDF